MADRRTLPLAAAAPLLIMLALPLARPAAAPVAPGAAPRIVRARVLAPDQLRLWTSAPVTRAEVPNFRFTERSAPDAPAEIRAVRAEPDGGVTLTLGQPVRASERYHVEVLDPPMSRDVAPSTWAVLVTVFLSSALINNFVFTRYLGLCIFFGVSKKRDTSIGMGVTFTAVMLCTALFSWAADTFVLRPLHLGFLQILVFIGTVAAVVQFLDTMLKKTHPALHRAFGVYLMLITTNCIILAVPLLNAGSSASFGEALALALGSGLGFALALFLMSCAREKLELARVPKAFEGLPIAFALAGLFALAFMGFSGLDLFR
jgi:electron transport complex protein RnfA